MLFRLNEKGLALSQKWSAADEEEEEEEIIPTPTDPVKLLQRPLTPDKIKKDTDNTEPAAPKGKKRSGAKGGKKKSKPNQTEQAEDDKLTKDEQKEDRKDKPQIPMERQRAYKERHKGSYGNHNRQKLSAMKRGFH